MNCLIDKKKPSYSFTILHTEIHLFFQFSINRLHKSHFLFQERKKERGREKIFNIKKKAHPSESGVQIPLCYMMIFSALSHFELR